MSDAGERLFHLDKTAFEVGTPLGKLIQLLREEGAAILTIQRRPVQQHLVGLSLQVHEALLQPFTLLCQGRRLSLQASVRLRCQFLQEHLVACKYAKTVEYGALDLVSANAKAAVLGSADVVEIGDAQAARATSALHRFAAPPAMEQAGAQDIGVTHGLRAIVARAAVGGEEALHLVELGRFDNGRPDGRDHLRFTTSLALLVDRFLADVSLVLQQVLERGEVELGAGAHDASTRLIRLRPVAAAVERVQRLLDRAGFEVTVEGEVYKRRLRFAGDQVALVGGVEVVAKELATVPEAAF